MLTVTLWASASLIDAISAGVAVGLTMTSIVAAPFSETNASVKIDSWTASAPLPSILPVAITA